jgi:hypothetical protein
VAQQSKSHRPSGPRRGLRPGVRFRVELRRYSRTLRRHREDAALLFGVAALTFSLIGTCNNLDQLAIQRNSFLPQLAVNVRPSRDNEAADAVELIVTNNGGVINGLQVDCKSFIPMRIKLPEKRDTLLTYLPVENYFCSITKTYQSKGVIARAAPTPTTPNADVDEEQAQSTYRGADLSVRPGRAHHVVHIAYTDAFGKRSDRFFVVSEMESWEAPAGDWRRLTDSLVVRQATRRRFDLNRASSANVLRWARASVPAGRGDGGLLKRLRVIP